MYNIKSEQSLDLCIGSWSPNLMFDFLLNIPLSIENKPIIYNYVKDQDSLSSSNKL